MRRLPLRAGPPGALPARVRAQHPKPRRALPSCARRLLACADRPVPWRRPSPSPSSLRARASQGGGTADKERQEAAEGEAAKQHERQKEHEQSEAQQREQEKLEREKGFDPEAFSLATAVALGCCSFEAYNAPYRQFGVTEVSPCGTEVFFMDRDFLSRRIAGVLEVHLRRAVGLPLVTPREGKPRELPNARACVSVAPSAGFSEVFERSVDPSWRQTFFLYVRDPKGQQLQLRLEHRQEGSDAHGTLLGTAELEDLEGLCDGEVHELCLPLRGEGGHEAAVELSCRFQPHSADSDLLAGVRQQAAGQQLIDDWHHSDSEAEDWGNEGAAASPDWRFRGFPLGGSDLDGGGTDVIEEAILAEGQPLDRPPWKDWTALRDAVMERQLFTSLEPLAFVVNEATDSEAWVYRSQRRRQLVIAFRGTSTPKDMVTDMALDLAAFNPPGLQPSKAPEQVAEELSDEVLEEGPLGGLYKGIKALERLPGIHLLNQALRQRAKLAKGGKKTPLSLSDFAKAQMMMLYAVEHEERWCHKGFLEAYQSVSPVLMRLVDDALAQGSSAPAPPASAPKPAQSEPPSSSGGGSSSSGSGGLGGLLSSLLGVGPAPAAPASAAAEAAAAEGEAGFGAADGGERWHVYVTGHSLGGALATLCAQELAVREYPQQQQKPEVTMYSFGQPRVGNAPFARQYDADVPDSWRVKNHEDIVTRVPSLLGYQHIGCEVLLFPHGKLALSAASTDDVREGAVLTDLLPKIKAGFTGEDKELQAEFQALVKGELDVARALLGGAGVVQHMENVYHDTLHACTHFGEQFCQPVIARELAAAKREAAEHLRQQKQRKKQGKK